MKKEASHLLRYIAFPGCLLLIRCSTSTSCKRYEVPITASNKSTQNHPKTQSYFLHCYCLLEVSKDHYWKILPILRDLHWGRVWMRIELVESSWESVEGV